MVSTYWIGTELFIFLPTTWNLLCLMSRLSFPAVMYRRCAKRMRIVEDEWM